MQNPGIILAAILLVLSSACGNGNSGSTEKKDTMQNHDSIESTAKPESSSGWEDVGGVKVRKNNDIKAQLEGNSYVKYESYNSGGGSGGYSSEARMTFCPGGKLSMYTQSVTTINLEGAGGSSAGEDSDDGSFEVYEDQQGNLFLKLQLRKGGEGFIHIILDGSQMKFEDGRVLTRKAGGC